MLVRVSRERKPVGCVYIHIYIDFFLIGTCDCTGITNFKSAGRLANCRLGEELSLNSKRSLLGEFLLAQRKSVFVLVRLQGMDEADSP